MTSQRDRHLSRAEQNEKPPTHPQADQPPRSQGIDQRTARIREFNDLLRTTGRGGMVVLTSGIGALGLPAVNRIFAAVACFSDFSPDNDPWGEHDCVVQTVDGIKVIWKIDYFDRSRTVHSPDPTDPKLTVRVLTVMRAEEY